MTWRTPAAEGAALAATVLWVYGGGAVAVSAGRDDASLSFWAAAAVVGLAYGLVRLLQRRRRSDAALRLWGTALGVGALYMVLRIDVAGDARLWDLGWAVDLYADTGHVFADHPGGAAEVIALGIAWVWSTTRATRPLTTENALGDAGLGLLVLLVAAAFGPRAGAPEAVRWLPAPYMLCGLLAVALANADTVPAAARRSFWSGWTVWTAGGLTAIAAVSALATALALPSLEGAGALLGAGADLLIRGFLYAITPVVFVTAWIVESVIDLLPGGGEIEQPPLPESPPEAIEDTDNEPAGWVTVIGSLLRGGLLTLACALALLLLWAAYGRFGRRRQRGARPDETEYVGEGALGDLRSLLSDALGRLRRRPAGTPLARDPVGRLYFSVLARAARQGLPRPAAATPLEFAPRLDDHFGPPLPGAISASFSEARYGQRAPSREELQELRTAWTRRRRR